MFSNLLIKTAEGSSITTLGRARRFGLAVLFTVLFILAFGYHVLLWSTGNPFPPVVDAIYGILVIVEYTALWLLLSSLLQRRSVNPAKTLWTTLLLGVFFLGAGRVIMNIGAPPDDLSISGVTALGFNQQTGVPLTMATVFKTNMLSLLQASFAILLLLRLRDLVLFKRTKSSQRNWYLMLGTMVIAALFTFLKDPLTEPGWTSLAWIPAIGLMVTNSFRLSWIVFLSFKEKMASIGLSFLLLALLAAGYIIGDISLFPGSKTYITYYSYPLGVFTLLSLIFGILYATTAFLSLLFHLPTTSDFQQKVGEMAAMHSLTTLVSQAFDPERLAYTIAASPVEAGSATASWLGIADLQSGSLRPRIVAAHNITSSRISELVDTQAFYEEILLKREPILLEQAPTDHRINSHPGSGLGSLLVVPLLARDELLGALFVTKEVTHGFEKDDIESISAFAAQAALALDHARLFEEQIEKERLSREIAIAREVQRKLLPQHLPYIEGLSIAASNVSAQEVGGDYYDFVRIDDDRLAVIAADVSGKGTHAAFYMAELQGIFHSLSRLVPSPADFLTHANEAIAQSLEKHIFITAIYGVIDTKKEQFVLARAGHCPVAMIHLDGNARLLRSQGLGLGLDRGVLFQKTLVEEKVDLQPGDVFVLYTDGIVESRNETGEEYGYDRLLNALRENRFEDAPELHNAVLEDIRRFLGHDHFDDDMTIVVIKWHGIRYSTSVALESRKQTQRVSEKVQDVEGGNGIWKNVAPSN